MSITIFDFTDRSVYLMSNIRFIGDIHGDHRYYLPVIEEVEKSIQVGDYGIGFVSNPIPNNMTNHEFIRGNHDYPALCKHQHNYIPDGTVRDNMMFVGGATSIDRFLRTPGYNWWWDEECSEQELEQFVDTYKKVKPEIMITHECPETFSNDLCNYVGIRKYNNDPSRTRETFDRMLQIHQPKVWIFGHWHHNVNMFLYGTEFICLAPYTHMDFDTETLEKTVVFNNISLYK